MKGKLGLCLHLAALLIAGICAYLVFSQGQEDKAEQGKVILDVRPEQVDRLAFDTGKKQVEVVARKGGGFTVTISEQTHKPDTTAAPAPAEEKKPAAMITETKVDSYRASQEFERTLERLLPLRAERDLGKVDQKKLSKFGLVEDGRTLVVEARGQKVTYLLGGQSYGGATTYMLQQPDGPVYLISSTLVRSIDVRADRYLERRLVEAAQKDVERIAVGTLTASRELLQQKREKKTVWVPVDAPESTNDLFSNWMDKVFRLAATEYLRENPVPPPRTEAKLIFFSGGERLDELELASAEAGEGTREYFARSAFTGGWVKLRRQDVDAVVADLGTVLEQ